jgi:molecular chaperone HscA
MGRMPEPQQGFAIGVDLGTSNTLAVLRWPDGRTRPLMVDGAPIMPSGVYADESGQLHVGRDAQRLAGLDPARFEPNPKRRIDEGTVLLGGREVAIVDLLAAVFGAVARAAVEAIGFLPPAVLTYPAAWGAPRRETLAAAAARAGWPPVRMVPEPVAAARYFADVLRRPIPVGASLAVFDFGGGTLDVAVVRNENGHFAVLGSGGIEDLGGLDVDAALVEHLGRVLAETAGGLWNALSKPETTTQRRDRRLFWEDVRGAKEMLSRTAVAPIAVPGRDQAVHLTREELERAAEPLMRRAVWETGAVIKRCGLRPDQLAGLFLVGGSSRLPLAARLLHAELGVPPTVLEQPELPVAEGALADLPQAPPATGQAGAGAAGALLGAAPVSAPVAALPTQVWYRRPVTWIAAATSVLVLAIVATIVLVKLGNPVSDVKFATLRAGVSVDMGDANSIDSAASVTLGDRSYYGWVADKAFHFGAVDLKDNHKLWGPSKVDADFSKWSLYALPNTLVAVADGSSGPGALYVFDAASGRENFHVPFVDRDRAYFFADLLVLHLYNSKEMRGLAWKDGALKWSRPNPKTDYDNDALSAVETTDADLRGPATLAGVATERDLNNDPKRLVQVGADKKFYLVDAAKGTAIRSWNAVGDFYSKYLAYGGKLYVAYDTPYRVQAYDLTKQDEPQSIYSVKEARRTVGAMSACGVGRICLLDTASSDEKTTEITAIDVATRKELWRKPAPGADQLVPVGSEVLAASVSGNAASFLYSADGRQLLSAEDRKLRGARVNGGSLLFFAGNFTVYGNDDLSLIGVTAASGARTALGPLQKVRGPSCSWNERAIVCATDSKIQAWRFA